MEKKTGEYGADPQLLIKALEQRHQDDEIHYTSCFQNGCMDGVCLLKVHVKDNKITAIESDDSINPNNAREDVGDAALNQGLIQCRACPMGHAWKNEMYLPTRITHPLKRVGERGEGKFEEISWEEALDTIAQAFKDVMAKRGAHSILHTCYTGFTNSSLPLAPWLNVGGQSAAIAAYGMCSFEGTAPSSRFHLGIDPLENLFNGRFDTFVGNEAPDFFNSKLIILWGANSLVTNFGAYSYYLKLAREKGTPIVVIDPRYTATAETLADQWIPIRPGTDLYMQLAVANVLFEEDLYDHKFVEQWVDLDGFEKWRAYVTGANDKEPKTPEWAESKCGVPAQTIREFARLYASSKPTYVKMMVGTAKIHRGEYTSGAMILLQAMTGNTLSPGGSDGGVSYGTAGHLIPPFFMPEQAAPDCQAQALYHCPLWAEAIVNRPKVDAGELTEDEYNNIVGNASGDPLPNIGMMVFENNLLNNTFDVNKNIEAVKALDFAWGILYHTTQPAAKYCDIVLPAPVSFFESSDPAMVYMMNQFIGAAPSINNYFIYTRKCVDAPDGVRPRMWVWTEIAKRLGIAEKFNPTMLDVSWQDWDEVMEEKYHAAYDQWLPRFGQLYGAPTWEEFIKKPILRVPIDVPYSPYKVSLDAGKTPFSTSTGKIEFYSHYVADQDMTKTHFAGNYEPMPTVAPAYMPGPAYDSFYSEKAADYPLYALSPISIYRQHSAQYQNELMNGDCYRQSCWISVNDAKARDIKDGDLVRVFSNKGEMQIPAYVTSRLVPGTVAVNHGAWYTAGEKTELMPDGIDLAGCPNVLYDNRPSEHIAGNMIKAGLVQVEPAGRE